MGSNDLIDKKWKPSCGAWSETSKIKIGKEVLSVAQLCQTLKSYPWWMLDFFRFFVYRRRNTNEPILRRLPQLLLRRHRQRQDSRWVPVPPGSVVSGRTLIIKIGGSVPGSHKKMTGGLWSTSFSRFSDLIGSKYLLRCAESLRVFLKINTP